MYFLDRKRDRYGGDIYRTANFNYPLRRNRHGSFKVKSGETLMVCMTSDFFLAEADQWRPDAWRIMAERPDVKFLLITKRPERVRDHLPPDWGDGWENVFFNVTAENQRRADERVPLLLELPFRHKGVTAAPLIGRVDLSKYLSSGQIEQVTAGGENYDGARPCRFEWIQKLRADCEAHNVTFCFFETGTVFVKDNKRYHLPEKRLQSQMAWKSQMSFEGKPMVFKLKDSLGFPIREEDLYHPTFKTHCQTCGNRMVCNGCSHCRKCFVAEAERKLVQ